MAKNVSDIRKIALLFSILRKMCLQSVRMEFGDPGGIWNGNGTTAAELNGTVIGAFMLVCLNIMEFRN